MSLPAIKKLHAKIEEVQNEIDTMTPLRLVPDESMGRYHTDAVYQDAMAYSQILADSIDNLYSTAQSNQETNQMAQGALDTLEAKFGPTGPVQEAPAAPTETISGLVKEVTGEYRIAHPKVA